MDGIIELTEKIFTVQREVCGYLLHVSVKKTRAGSSGKCGRRTKTACWLCDPVCSTHLPDRRRQFQCHIKKRNEDSK